MQETQVSAWHNLGCSLGGPLNPGRPRCIWTGQLCNDTGSVPANLWTLEIDRPSYGATVEWCDGPSWLRDDNDNDNEGIL